MKIDVRGVSRVYIEFINVFALYMFLSVKTPLKWFS